MSILLFWFIIKHFVCDFPLQANKWFYNNKHIYGHPGGIAHAGIHALGTLLVFTFALFGIISSLDVWILAIMDGVIHYHIDWAKMNIGKKFNLKPDNSEWFWILLGLDQLLHYMTYLFLIWLAFHTTLDY